MESYPRRLYSQLLLFHCVIRINWIVGDAVNFFWVWNMHVCRPHMYIHAWNCRNVSVKFITVKSVLVVVRKIKVWFMLLPYSPHGTWNRLEMLCTGSWSLSEHCKYSLSFISSPETQNYVHSNQQRETLENALYRILV